VDLIIIGTFGVRQAQPRPPGLMVKGRVKVKVTIHHRKIIDKISYRIFHASGSRVPVSLQEST
jgi:hypothetical protein